jgi:chemotaxis protein CheC
MADDAFSGGFDDLLGGGESAPSQSSAPQISDFQRDSLRELGNIAAGQATITLSKYVKSEVKLGLPFMDIIPANNITMFMGDPGKEVTISHTQISGLISGQLLMVYPGKSALTLFDMVAGKQPGYTSALDASVMGMITKVSGDVAKAYMDALVDFLDIEIVCEDAIVASILGASVVSELKFTDDLQAMMLETDFAIPNSGLEGEIILLSDQASTDKLLNKVTEKLGG